MWLYQFNYEFDSIIGCFLLPLDVTHFPLIQMGGKGVFELIGNVVSCLNVPDFMLIWKVFGYFTETTPFPPPRDAISVIFIISPCSHPVLDPDGGGLSQCMEPMPT